MEEVQAGQQKLNVPPCAHPDTEYNGAKGNYWHYIQKN